MSIGETPISGILHLKSISINGETDNKVKPKYYANDEKFKIAKELTRKSPEIHGETAVVEITDNGATSRDLQARDILAKWIGGVSGFNQIMGSELEQEFIKANPEDFKQTGTVERNGKKYPVFTFDAKSSDGKVSMPTLQQNKKGEVFYMMGDKSYKADGTRTEPKYTTTFYNYDGTFDEVGEHPNGEEVRLCTGVYDWNLYGLYGNNEDQQNEDQQNEDQQQKRI